MDEQFQTQNRHCIISFTYISIRQIDDIRSKDTGYCGERSSNRKGHSEVSGMLSNVLFLLFRWLSNGCVHF